MNFLCRASILSLLNKITKRSTIKAKYLLENSLKVDVINKYYLMWKYMWILIKPLIMHMKKVFKKSYLVVTNKQYIFELIFKGEIFYAMWWEINLK